MTEPRAVDGSTGLGVMLPPGWVHWRDSPTALLLIDAEARRRHDTFVSSLAATVSPRNVDLNLDAVVVGATRMWLDAVEYAHVLGVQDWAPPLPDSDGRLVYATYSDGMHSLTLFTAFLVHGGIVSRLDLTVPIVASRDATELFFAILDSVTLPTTAPEADLSGSHIAAFQNTIVEGNMPS